MNDIHNAGSDGKLALTQSAKAVFRKLYADGPATRPQMCEALGLSRPTLSAAIANLDRYGLVEIIREVQGATGRKAAEYRLGAGAGHVIAVDAGSSHIRLRVTDLNKKLLHERILKLSSNQHRLSSEISRAVAGEVEQARAETKEDWGRLRAMGVALPSRVVERGKGASATGQDNLFTHFSPPDDLPVILENNVNCAAVAERTHGAAIDATDFAYIQVGLKIGMGIYLNGQLIRGPNGAAGEIGHLPFPFGPGQEPQAGELENHMGTTQLLSRAQMAWQSGPNGSNPPENSETLLDLAKQGNAKALELVHEHADNIGAIAASCVSTIDPGLIVLGGGIGSDPILLPRVRDVVDRLSYRTRIESSLLGADATVLGIERLATDFVCNRLMGSDTQLNVTPHTRRPEPREA